MKKVFFFFLLIPFFSFGQNQMSDKLNLLKKQLSNERNIDSILKLNNTIAIELKNNSAVDEAKELLHKNIKLSTKLNKQNSKAAALIILSKIFIQSSVLDSANFYTDKAIFIYKKIKLKDKLAKAFLVKSVIYQSQSDFKNQLKYNLLSLEVSKEINDYPSLAENYNGLAMYYLDQTKYKEALEAAKNNNKFALLSKNPSIISNSYSSLAESYSLLNDTINAEINFKKGYELAKKNGDNFSVAWYLTNWAKLKNNKEALKMRFKSQTILNKFGVNPMSLNNKGMIGLIYMKMYNEEKNLLIKKKYLIEAEKYLIETVENSESNSDIINSIEFNNAISKLFFIKKQFEKAYLYQEKSIVQNDSLNSQEIKNSLAKLESKKEIELRDNQIKINKLSLDAKEKQKWLFVAGIGFLAIIGGLLFYQSRKRKQINERLQVLNKTLDTKNLELDQANKAKTRFFGILNHDLRGPVANLVFFLQLQQESPEMLDAESIKRMQDKTMTGAENLLSTMEDILQWSKSQMENFKPQPKNVLVEQLFNDTKKVFSGYLKINFEYQNSNNISVFTDENYLKTIIRNLTSNAINVFTNTKNPTIIWKAWQENNISYFSIQDNGPGANEEQFDALFEDTEITSAKSGLGLYLIRDMAKAINCDITVNSVIGEGTTFTLKI